MGNSVQRIELLVPGRNLDAYIQAVSSIAVLSAEQECELAERLYYQNDLDAARQLVMSHLRFVVHIARSYTGYGLHQSDLIQEGNLGLMKAAKRFNPEYGVRLVSFAVHWIKAEIHEFILRNWRIVKVATTKAQRKLFFNLRSNKKRLGWFSLDEAKAVANDLGVDMTVVHEMESRMAGQDTAFDGYSDDDSDTSSYQAPVHYLEDYRYDPAKQVEERDGKDHSSRLLESAMSSLNERSRDILKSRWLNEDKKTTLQELAVKYSLSAERIRQLEANALKKLRSYMATTALNGI